ncbi:MAG: hypothetical protein L0214_10775 [candidate division NC10 bacterium]|nr:hypothetical protein [candidate division NC10 bacterium]
MRNLSVRIAIVAAMVGLGIVAGPADPAFAGRRAFVGGFHGKHHGHFPHQRHFVGHHGFHVKHHGFHGHFPHAFRGGKVFVGKPFFGPTVFVKRPFIGARLVVAPPVIVIR